MTILTPRQTRSEETLRRILSACDRLLDKRPFEQISMQDIAREAGVSVGNLYNRFTDKEGLMDYVLAEYQDRFQNGITALLAESEPGLDTLDRLGAFVDYFAKSIAKLRPIFVTMASRLARGDTIGPLVAARSESIVEICAAWLMKGDPSLDPERCRFAVASITSNLQFDLLFGTQSRLFGKSFEQQLVTQAHDYLVRTNS